MIIKTGIDNKYVIFKPENDIERRKLESFPGLLRIESYFFSPNKKHIVYSLYRRLGRTIKNIRVDPEIESIINSSWSLPKIPETFKFHTAPLEHQKLALRFMIEYENAGLLLQPGLGKTKVILDFIYLKGFSLSLIVCPRPLLHVWKEERDKHRPELSLHVFESTDWEKEMMKANGAQVLVINYDKAVILVEKILDLNIDFLGLDEGLIKNYKTERTKVLTKIGRNAKYRSIMSGTLINNSPLDVFAPIRFLEPSLIGTSVTRFKDRYAVLSPYNKNIITGFRDQAEIKEILDSCCIVMKKEEWLKDLPRKNFIYKECQMGDKQREDYFNLSRNYIANIGDENLIVKVENPMILLCKLTQISNGFIYFDMAEESPEYLDDTDNIRLTKYYKEQPKIDLLIDLLYNELGTRRVIVWFNLTAEKTLIEIELGKYDISFLTIAGKDKKIGEKINRFNNDPSIKVLLCQAQTINYGVTILGSDDEDLEEIPEFETKVHDEVFYSINFSLEIFLQQQDRIHRIGQTEECNYWILLTDSPTEHKIVKALEEKTLLNRTMLIDIAESLSEVKDI